MTVDVQAVVLVGGKGTRLRPLTLTTPKPMLPAAGVPFLTHLLRRIADAGIRHVLLSTSYRPEVFSTFFGDGSTLGLQLDYVTEDQPLGTAGGIRNVLPALSAPQVLVFNGDVLSGLDPRAVLTTHRRADADATMHLVRVPDPRAFGCVPTEADGRVLAFLEKTDEPPTDQINAGCYVFDRDVLISIPAGRAVSVERETFPGLVAGGARVQAHVDDSYWLDLGTPGAYVQGSADLVRGIAPSSALPGPAGEAIVDPTARVEEGAVLDGGCAVGAGCVIGADARVHGSVLAQGARLDEGAQVIRSALGAGARAGTGTVLCDAVLGDRVQLGAGCELREGARVWPDVTLPAGAIRFSSDV